MIFHTKGLYNFGELPSLIEQVRAQQPTPLLHNLRVSAIFVVDCLWTEPPVKGHTPLCTSRDVGTPLHSDACIYYLGRIIYIGTLVEKGHLYTATPVYRDGSLYKRTPVYNRDASLSLSLYIYIY